MTDPHPGRQPQQSPPADAMQSEPKDRKDGDGCLVALLILMGMPLVLLGLFVGLCAVAGRVPLLLLIGLVPLGLGIWLLTVASKKNR